MSTSLNDIPRHDAFEFAKYYNHNKDLILDIVSKNPKMLQTLPVISIDMYIAAAKVDMSYFKYLVGNVSHMIRYVESSIERDEKKGVLDINDIVLFRSAPGAISHVNPDHSRTKRNKATFNNMWGYVQSPNRGTIVDIVLKMDPMMVFHLNNMGIVVTEERFKIALNRRPECAVFFRTIDLSLCILVMEKFIELYKGMYSKEEFDELFCKFFENLPVSTKDRKVIDHAAVKLCGAVIQKIDNQTDELCVEAINTDPEALAYIDTQKKKYVDMAIGLNGLAIAYVDDASDDVWKVAIKNSPHAIQYSLAQKPEHCELALDLDPTTLEHIKDPTPDMILNAVSRDGLVLQHVYKQTLRIGIAAIKQNTKATKYINKDLFKVLKEKYNTDLAKHL